MNADGKGFRREVLDFLTSPSGQRVWGREVESKRLSERAFHEALRSRASTELRRLLMAIDAYERFARLIQNAFDDCLYEMTRRRGYVSASQLGRLDTVRRASRQAGAAVRAALRQCLREIRRLIPTDDLRHQPPLKRYVTRAFREARV